VGETLCEAFENAFRSDRQSPYGGILACNGTVDGELAARLKDLFLEVIIAPDYREDALNRLSRRKNLRVIRLAPGRDTGPSVKSIWGGLLIQEQDGSLERPDRWTVVTAREPGPGEMEALDLDIASGFVQMAAHLLYIKTRMLLAGDKEVTELELLVSTLEQLRRRDDFAAVQSVVPELAGPLERGMQIHTRLPEPLPATGGPSYSHRPGELLIALAPILLRSAGRNNPRETILRAAPPPLVYGVREKSRELLRLLRENGSMRLGGLYSLCAGRSEVVATFLSVLELCSAGSLFIIRSEDDCEVSMVSPRQEVRDGTD
jgi:segregation and condensation protein A